MSEKIGLVQETFSGIYHLDIEEINASQTFDYLFEDDEHFLIGQLDAYALCLSYVMGDAVFVGDMRFMPDYGTARCDFPRGSGATLYGSIQRLYQLSE